MATVNVEQLLEALGYADSPNYLPTEGQHDSLTAHLFRAANTAGAEGAYVFHTSPDDEVLPVRPAVYIAEATTEDEAREIHRCLWNLGNAPFLIILLPYQVRVYTGFDYARSGEKRRSKERGLIDIIDLLMTVDLGEALADYSADSIDSGRLWKNRAEHLTPERRVDVQLLKNLKKLEDELVKDKLELATAHALIGKYVYIRYLYDRNILSPQWLNENNIEIDSVLSRRARLRGLRRLVEALDERFNGHIFPFPLSGEGAPTDEHVSLVASAFKGDDPTLRQMHLDFEPFDFSYIPIETLSSIYEQFLRAQGTGKRVGAIYTPEPLADYLIAELSHAKPLERGMKVLDPCCGSGIFLVLAYRKLIEMELSNRPDGKLRPSELRQILTESIFGVERNPDACFVAELSLILTMLHYISPPDLHRNKQFQFPDLHNSQIFEADFFDESLEFWQKRGQFDWVLGNPPWIEPEKDLAEERLALTWIYDRKNRRERPVAGNRVAEAFSWRVTDLVKSDGCIGLVMPAMSLFNHESKKYRREFFRQNEVLKVTNFANLAYVLFVGRGKAPAATIIYRKALPGREKVPIVHYGPFVVDQVLNRFWQEAKTSTTWILTINENDIQTIPAHEAETGEAVIWKVALWGNYRDRKALQRLRRLYTTKLEELAQERGWHLYQGIRLVEGPSQGEEGEEKVEAIPHAEGQKFFNADAMNKSGHRFSIPTGVLQKIPPQMCFIRKRSGKSGLKIAQHPHLLLNASYFVFSDQDFYILAPHTALSAPASDADHLRALSVFLSSSVALYYLFFLSPSWGIERSRIYAEDIKQVPVPNFTADQIDSLANLQKELTRKEAAEESSSRELQELLDEGVEEVLGIPKNLSIIARDFVQVRLLLTHGKTREASQSPRVEDLYDYGSLLRDELNDFAKGKVQHKVSFIYSLGQELIVCAVEVTQAGRALEVTVDEASDQLKESLAKVKQKLRRQHSQWFYVQRGLRIFDDTKVYICKTPRIIDWTRTQALNDSDDLIADVLNHRNSNLEVVTDGAR